MRIKKLREKNGLTQRDLAAATSVPAVNSRLNYHFRTLLFFLTVLMLLPALSYSYTMPVDAAETITSTTTAYTGWKTASGNKYYYIDGKKATGFQTINGKTYYFNKHGKMKTGWLSLSDGRKYYFSTKGIMQTGLKTIKGSRYYFIENEYNKGVMANVGLYKNFIISYTGKCYSIPNQKTGNMTADANRVAKLVAQCSGNKKMTDLERVKRAAFYVSAFSSRAKYTMSGPYYNKPYGVFIAKEYSCAGSTRALGLVLDYMGFKWTHVNENQYSHQWCRLTMDGKIGYADGQVGYVGYGKHPVEK